MPAHTNSLLDASEHFNRSWADLSGDFILRARIRLPAAKPGARAGWLLRCVGGEGPCVEACLHDDGQVLLLLHSREGGTLSVRLPVHGAEILQLERRGDSLVLSAAIPGEPLVHSAPVCFAFPTLLQGGLFDCHQNPDTDAASRFSELRAIKPPKAGYVPYTDYIGSRLEILTVGTGGQEIVYSSQEAFEAPNWRPDGRTLIFNVSGPGPAKGLLRNFELLTRTVTPLDTGFGTRNNNDHVLSFDGRQLAISHHAEEDEGRSVIYTLPSSGGTPRRVTPKSPSYLHGWSPDARWLVYTGGRRPGPGAPEKYDIYKIPAEGGEELRLTDSPGLSDGPEFSPDGRHIYYNSTRSGLMQLWRMRADGSGQEQLTDDAFNNWFPHLSPDGKWLAFLSYGQEVQPWEHPYYKHVYLRLMRATGGPARVVAYIYGGQGTVNVPCWSPDGTQIAFVSNSG